MGENTEEQHHSMEELKATFGSPEVDNIINMIGDVASGEEGLTIRQKAERDRELLKKHHWDVIKDKFAVGAYGILLKAIREVGEPEDSGRGGSGGHH